ncbi:MAG: peptide ABC transporter substrate-binding protein [Deltaproteobacteria bacterium HGW-Deltaproteobacteria-14]|nr:MAG: peptide ABC transporter substrate-binding protein [Deltaproteobacteria bacterium HGW-Deltaproteobacteria-14]
MISVAANALAREGARTQSSVRSRGGAGQVLVALALALALALGACKGGGGDAPAFTAPPPPEAQADADSPPAPAADVLPTEPAATVPDAAQVEPETESGLLDHIYGRAVSWPCEGHPVCDEPSPADGMLGLDVTDLEYIDPGMVVDTEGLMVAQSLFEGLVNPPPRSGMPIQPGVATRWERSEDGLVYTFHLRDDARWSDGHPVTAGDFVWAWRRKLDPKLGSTGVEPLFRIKNAKEYNAGTVTDAAEVGVVAPDAHTLVVTLETPAPFFMQYLTMGHFLPAPEPTVTAHGKAWTRPENIVSNGAFVLEEWTPKTRLVLEKNPTYWDAANVRLPGAILYISESHAQGMTRYRTGATQWGRQAVITSDIPGFIEERRPDLFIDPYLCYYSYIFRIDRKPFDDVRVRRALNMAIDKQGLVDHVTEGMQQPADGAIPPYLVKTLGYPKPAGDPYDPKRARALLAEAGYPGGAGFPKVTLLYNNFESHRLIAEYVQRNVEEQLGVHLELSNMEWKGFLSQLRTGDFQIARFGSCGIDHPYSLLADFGADYPENHTAYANSEYDALLQKALRAPDRVTEMKLYADAEAMLQRDMPFAPLYYYTRLYLKKPVLQGLEPELTNNHLLKYMYWADKPGTAP